MALTNHHQDPVPQRFPVRQAVDLTGPEKTPVDQPRGAEGERPWDSLLLTARRGWQQAERMEVHARGEQVSVRLKRLGGLARRSEVYDKRHCLNLR